MTAAGQSFAAAGDDVVAALRRSAFDEHLRNRVEEQRAFWEDMRARVEMHRIRERGRTSNMGRGLGGRALLGRRASSARVL